ncbi:MAG TPA: ferritin-like domain-containing protein [Bryobacteraceae bacterium]|nr:ferritin-like domain-containing protein [Bryobacteraceae bacterium]
MTDSINGNSAATRRNFALGAGLVGAALAGLRANAQTSTTPEASDIAVLNFALTLEHLEAAIYTQGLSRFTAANFGTAGFTRVLGTGTAAGVYANLGRIRDHEVAHVDALRSTIRTLGGTPVEPCTYNFTYSNVDQFLQIAQSLEELGVQAYDGGIAMLSAAALKAAGASIATVEARHAAYLNLVNSNVPFPKAFDETKMMREVLSAAAQYITSCGTTPVGMSTTALLLPKNLTTLSRQVSLDASQSLSGTGQPLTYELRVISGAASIIQGNTATPSVQLGGGFGDYVFELVVTDSAGTQSTDRITIRYAGQ